MRVLDLFSGIGGFSLGLNRAGMDTVAFCEIDPFCKRVLAKHWPGVPILEDVTAADFPSADIIVGGFPCQDISGAGKRAGVAGARSGLYRELVRAIRMVRPKHAIVENVADLLSGPPEQPGEWFHQVLGDLAEGGACIEWDCVSASAIGAPHERDRVWIVVTDAEGRDDRLGDGSAEVGQEPEPRDGAGSRMLADAPGVGCGPRRAWRPPDSFAWIRNATRRNAANANGTRHAQRQGERGDARQEQQTTERNSGADVWKHGWPDEPALLGVDDGVPDWSHRVRAIGNALVPDIPELIGRTLMEGGIDDAA